MGGSIMMDLTFLTELYQPMVIALCLVVGYVLKHWVKDVDNKFIPTILVAIGIVAACIDGETVSIELIVSGALSALASTGLHQAFKQLIGQQ
jgi:hypothetical protein